jgi:rare lipoprotein A
MRKLLIGLAVAATVTLSPASEARPPACVAHPLPIPVESSHQEGVASWYGEKFHGRITASGQAYDMYGLTAAHPALPLGTRIRVTNLRNNRSIILRVNDRGPSIPGRMLDVSLAAAGSLGFVNAGLTRVRVEIVNQSLPQRAPSAQAARSVVF